MALEPITVNSDGWTSLGTGAVTRTIIAKGGGIRLGSGSMAGNTAQAGIGIEAGQSYDLDPGIEYHARAWLSTSAVVELIERAT